MSIPPVSQDRCLYPVREKNVVHPWVDGVPFYERLHEAFMQARSRVWFLISFLHRDFTFPNGQTLWDTLDTLHAKGIDVRVLFWRNPHFFNTSHLFLGDGEDLAFLRRRNALWKARWDSSAEDVQHCHHQKFWLVDAGTPDEIGFVGGMVWGNTTLDTPAHLHQINSKHDICVELHGPVVSDVTHTFVMRWNQIGVDPTAPLHWPDADRNEDLSWPLPPSEMTDRPKKASSLWVYEEDVMTDCRVQLSQTLKPGLYQALQSYDSIDVREGETRIWAQYLLALQHAQHSIYIENQHPGEHKLLEALEAAIERGVHVVYVVPSQPMDAIYAEHKRVLAYRAGLERGENVRPPRYLPEFEALGRLAQSELFTFAALSIYRPSWPASRPYAEIYVHAKICIVDGQWATCGSANLVDISMHANHTEMNVSIWKPQLCRQWLKRLVEEHTDIDLSEDATEVEWLSRLRECASQNVERRAKKEPLQGHIYALDAGLYPSSS